MEHQYIEKGEKKLYSVYHEPTSFGNDEWGILLCHPLGQEYIRCYKLYVNLANKAATQGFHTLRFDYQGTGDSSGDFSSVLLDECIEDIELAANELKESCGVSKILFIGVRFGATLSLLYSKKYRGDALVLWSPIFSGSKYLKEIVREYKMWLSGSFTKENRYEQNAVVSFGFSFSSHLVKEIQSIFLCKTHFETNFPILLIDNEEPVDIKGLSNITFKNTVNKEFWFKKENEYEKSMVPVNELNLIMDWVRSNLK